MTVIRQLYSLALWLVQPLLKAKLRKRALSEPGYAHAVEQRFGYYDLALRARQAAPAHSERVAAGAPQAASYVWLHAVSLGETRAAAVLVAALRVRYPGVRLLLTHGTATGWAQGTALLQAGDVQVWQPWDTPGAVQRFLDHFRPRLGLLMETEVWPNMVAACRAARIPLCLVNARMSNKSLQKAQRLAWLSGPAYRNLTAVWAQTDDDAARLRALGAPVQGVTGNLKFDASPDAAQLAQGRAWRAASTRPVLMFASAREGEEQMLLDALRAQPVAGVQWLIVPRHPQRFDAVADLFAAAGLAVSRRSTWTTAPTGAGGASPQAADNDNDNDNDNGNGNGNGPADIWLGDSLGEMALYYGMADMALLGGSFAPLGGQNLIEAAACGCPVLMGPHTFNFAQAAEMAQAEGAALRCADLPDALVHAAALLADANALAQARQAALAWSVAHQGATRRTLDALESVLA